VDDNTEFLNYWNSSQATQVRQLKIRLVSSAYTATNMAIAWDSSDTQFCDTIMPGSAGYYVRNDPQPEENGQIMVDSAALDGTQYVGVWVKQNEAQYGGEVDLQVFDVNGQPTLAQPVVVACAGGSCKYPRVDRIAGNQSVVTWAGNSTPYVKTAVYSGGQLVSGPRQLSGNGNYPDVAGYSNPGVTQYYWATWKNNSTNSIELQRCPTDNGACQALIPGVGDGSAVNPLPTVASFPVGTPLAGGVAIVWIRPDPNGPSKEQVALSCYTAAGALSAGPFVLNPDISNPEGASIGMFADGSFAVAWADNDNGAVRYALRDHACGLSQAQSYACSNTDADPAMWCTAQSSFAYDTNNWRISLAVDPWSEQFRIGYIGQAGTNYVFRSRLVSPGTADVLRDDRTLQTPAGGFVHLLHRSASLAIDPVCGTDVFAIWADCPAATCVGNKDFAAGIIRW